MDTFFVDNKVNGNYSPKTRDIAVNFGGGLRWCRRIQDAAQNVLWAHPWSFRAIANAGGSVSNSSTITVRDGQWTDEVYAIPADGYKFSHWTNEYGEVISRAPNLAVQLFPWNAAVPAAFQNDTKKEYLAYANFERNGITIRFFKYVVHSSYADHQGELLVNTQTITPGQTPIAPAVPDPIINIKGWTWDGWDKEIGPCWSDTDFFGHWHMDLSDEFELNQGGQSGMQNPASEKYIYRAHKTGTFAITLPVWESNAKTWNHSGHSYSWAGYDLPCYANMRIRINDAYVKHKAKPENHKISFTAGLLPDIQLNNYDNIKDNFYVPDTRDIIESGEEGTDPDGTTSEIHLYDLDHEPDKFAVYRVIGPKDRHIAARFKKEPTNPGGKTGCSVDWHINLKKLRCSI